MSTKVVVSRKVHNNVPSLFRKVAAASEKAGAEYGVRRARLYVPVRTGRLKASIDVIGNDSFGSDVRYAGYVDQGTRYMRAQPYMDPAARDVADEMPRIIKAAFRRWARIG